MINMKKLKTIRLFSAFIVACIFIPVDSFAQSSEANKSKKQTTYKKARVLQTKTAKEMAKFYEAYERVKIVKVKDTDKESETFGQMIDSEEPDPDWATAKSILSKLRSNADNMKSYDRSVMWNSWGFVYYSEESDKEGDDVDYSKAMDAYTRVINEEDVTLPLRNQVLLTLATLHMIEEEYKRGIELILIWMDQVEVVTAQSWSLLATAYFQLEDYPNALDAQITAVDMAEVEGYTPKENWYVILSLIHI